MIIIKKNGFTLVELILVIGIVAAASVLIGTNFMRLVGNASDYEDEVIAKGIAEAAYVYFDSDDNSSGNNCITAETLIDSGYISSRQGLLKKYSLEDLKEFAAYVNYDAEMEKIVKVYKNAGSCSGTEITYEN